MNRRIGLFLMVALLLISHVAAKGPSDRIILTGPTIEGERILTDPALVYPLSMGRLEDFMRGPVPEPDAPGAVSYHLERQYEMPVGEFHTFDQLQLYPDSGLIHYEGIVNGSSEYDGKWFQARPEALVVLETIFDPAARPYLVLLHDRGNVHFLDPVTLQETARITLFADVDPLPLLDFVDGPDTQTFYFDTLQAGFTEHHRVSLTDRSICRVDALPLSAAQASGALWIAGMMADDLSRETPGTPLKPIGVFGDGLVLLYHPLGRDRLYDYGAEDRGEIPGGILVRSQVSNQQVHHWQPDIGFAEVLAGNDRLYALEAPRGDTRVQLYALDGHSGNRLQTRALESGTWHLGYAVLDLTSLQAADEIVYANTCHLRAWELPYLFQFTTAALMSGG